MTPDQQHDFRVWMEGRFDRIDEKVDARFAALAEELKTTRHGFRPLMDQLAVQVAELVTTSRVHDREISDIKAENKANSEWRDPDGPLERRLTALERWRSTLVGAMTVISMILGYSASELL